MSTKIIVFFIIMFLSTMTYLGPHISNDDTNTYRTAYVTDELYNKPDPDASGNPETPLYNWLKGTPKDSIGKSGNPLVKDKSAKGYYDLTWKEKLEMDKSVWGFDLREILILSLLFGIFIGSLKLAVNNVRK